MKTKTDFLLSKWYLDCVAPNGDTFIGYHAAMKWKALAFNYSASITNLKKQGPESRRSLKKIPPPQVDEAAIYWDSPSLNVKGKWTRGAKPFCQTLFESPEGLVSWECVMPQGEGEIVLDDANPIRGNGYIEHLTLTIKPWLLPIEELRWGRFHSPESTVVWIEWREPAPRQFVYLDGVLQRDSSVTDTLVTVDNGNLSLILEDKAVLRKGALVSTALSSIPGLNEIVPNNLMNAFETKWRSRGVLNNRDCAPGKGWAIHETIKFR